MNTPRVPEKWWPHLPKRTNWPQLSAQKLQGRLLSGSAFKAGFGYIVGVPVAAYLTWEGKLIEGRGVSPTIQVELPPEQLLAGEDPQMQKALEIARSM